MGRLWYLLDNQYTLPLVHKKCCDILGKVMKIYLQGTPGLLITALALQNSNSGNTTLETSYRFAGACETSISRSRQTYLADDSIHS
jgi:hypothetical protein